MKPTIAIVGASSQQHKFGNKAVRAYLRQGWEVYPINPRAQTIEGLRSYRSVSELPVDRLDRISVYLPPEIGLQIVDDLASKPSTDVWLNPGAGSAELVRRGKELGLHMVLGCSIVAVGENPDVDE